jgi:GMP synthase (glutamine-hydrolysing) A subunit
MSGIGRPIVVLDFGAQYSKLIARRVREAHVYSLIEPYNISPEKLRALNPAGIILSGGPASVHAEGSPKPHPEILQFDVPILGICYGVQIFADMLGGKVERAAEREYGIAHLEHDDKTGLLTGIDAKAQVWMSHGDMITALPDGYHTIGKTENCPFAAIANPVAKRYGVQFHPEVVHTPQAQASACPTSCITCAAAAPVGHGSTLWRLRMADIREQRGRPQGPLRPERRRGFERGRGADPQGHRRCGSRAFL